ncbi:MAG: Imm52 family immunity protein [Thermoguttaceae bacterium]
MSTVYNESWYRQGFTIGVHWRRKDTHDVCVNNTHSFLKEFIEMFPFWLPFSVGGNWNLFRSFKDFQSLPDIDVINSIFTKGFDRDMEDWWGSDVDYKNSGTKNTNDKELNFKKVIKVGLRIGAYNGQFNSACIDFPPENDEIGEYLGMSALKKLFHIVIKYWRPASGRCSSGLLFGEEYNFRRVGWLTYFSKDFGTLPKLPDWAEIIPVEDIGNYVQATEELLDANNQEHIRRLCELEKILEPFWEANWQRVELP